MKHLVLLVIAVQFVFSQSFKWGNAYDPKVPKPEEIIGHKIGEYITEHYEMENYIKALAQVSDRVKLIQYGESYEKRKMYLIIISSPENIKNLDKIRKEIEKLTDPRITSEAEAKDIARRTPIIVWLNYANDGNESAAFEAGIQVAYQLAAGEDEVTKKMLKNAVVIINLPHNPDSHQKFVAWFKSAVTGNYGNPDRNSAQHHSDWRMDTNFNHYLIDLNRDAFACTQIETQKVVEEFHRWNPQVFVDHHGQTKNMFFTPYAPPVNLNVPESTKKWAKIIGKNIAKAFDEHGWSYYTGEVFDLFYPGYWDSYPALNGAIGMTYETDGGGRLGFRWERDDGTIVTLKDGILHHFVASMKTVETAVDNKFEILMDFYYFRKTALESARNEKYKAFVIVPNKDPEKTARFIELCLRHKIEVFKAKKDFRSKSARTYFDVKSKAVRFPAGSFIIPMAQPQKRLLKALFEPDPKMEEKFLKKARFAYEYNKKLGKKAKKLPLGFYDVTAWCLPIAWGVDAYLVEDEIKVDVEKVTSKPKLNPHIPDKNPKYAYVFSYQTDSGARLLAKLLKENFKVSVATRYFYTEDGTYFLRGSVIVRVERNKNIKNFHIKIKNYAKSFGVDLYAVNSAYTENGIDLGSNWVVDLKKPKIAVLTEEPVRQNSYGYIWFMLERMYEYDFTPVRWDYFSRVNLYKYDVLVIPDANARKLAKLLGKDGIKKIKDWVSNGGVLVTLKNASIFPTLKSVKLVKTRKDTVKREDKIPFTPGAILRVKLDTLHFLSLGYGDEIAVHIYSNLMFKKSIEGSNPGVFANKNLRISGFVWEDALKKFPGKAYLIDEPVGRGRVIMFADDPNFRLYWLSLNRLFLNAILLSPSF